MHVTCGNCYYFRVKNDNNFRISYTFRILQHFATKFWNFTSFERFFPGISFFVWIWLDQKLFYNANRHYYSKVVLLTGIARVKHACVTECDWHAKYGNYH